jgi:hypothetical protein
MPNLENTVIVSVTENKAEKAIVIKRAAKNSPLSSLASDKITTHISYSELSSVGLLEGNNSIFSLNGGKKGEKFTFMKLDKPQAGD